MIATKGGNTLSTYTYTLDSVGNRTQVQDGSGTESYTFENLYRLTEVTYTYTDSTSQYYCYDRVGNRTSMSSATTYIYDRADRIISTGYTVNANGNLTNRGSDTFAYDQANRMTSATVGGKVATFSYDGDGRRAAKSYDGLATTYVDDIAGGLPRVLEDGARKYVYGLGPVYAVQTLSGVETAGTPHADGLGSVRAVSDSSGATIQTYRSDEFGMPLESSGKVTQPFQYTGEERDEMGLVFLRARYYEPGTGRFMGRDPTGGVGDNPASLYRYAYAHNDPVNKIDPTGLWVGGWCMPNTDTGIALIAIPSFCVVFDGHGNRGIAVTAGGAGSTGASASITTGPLVSSADTIWDIEGFFGVAGASAGEVFLIVGVDVAFGPDREGKTVWFLTATVGAGGTYTFPFLPFEGHAGTTYAKVTPPAPAPSVPEAEPKK